MNSLRLMVVFVGVAGSILLGGCHRDGSLAPLEIFDYKYQVALGNGGNGYNVMRASQPECVGGRLDVMRMDQITQVVQLGDIGYESLINCSEEFFINMPAAREDGFSNKFKVRDGGSPTAKIIEVQVNGPSVGGRSLSPTGMLIQPGGPVTVGQRTTDGHAEIFFGNGGPVFRCESSGGDDPWTDHLRNPTTSTFFEFELTGLDSDFTRGSGNFKCIARNVTDPTDQRVLVILEGTFGMVVH